jgi:hypothetical protein
MKSWRAEQPDCPACGTWTCVQDRWIRRHASRLAEQSCPRCGGTEGVWIPVRHYNVAKAQDHIDTFNDWQREHLALPDDRGLPVPGGDPGDNGGALPRGGTAATEDRARRDSMTEENLTDGGSGELSADPVGTAGVLADRGRAGGVGSTELMGETT